MDAETIIRQLELERLPHEGGWFRRIHTDSAKLSPDVHGEPRAMGSGIYFLLTRDDFSAMHRLTQSVETFHWHAGDPVQMLLLYPDGSGETRQLGIDLDAGQSPISIVPRGVWQGSRLADNAAHGFALLTVMVTPEFLWDDFALLGRDALTAQYPAWADEIARLTRT
ncbi:MAG: cupin domain-containing protein [Puniceicoccales bacterium]